MSSARKNLCVNEGLVKLVDVVQIPLAAILDYQLGCIGDDFGNLFDGEVDREGVCNTLVNIVLVNFNRRHWMLNELPTTLEAVMARAADAS